MVCLAVGVIGRLLCRRLCRLLHRRLWVASPRHRGLDDLPSFLLSCHPCCCWIRRPSHSPRYPSCRWLRTTVPLPPSSALHHCRGHGDLSSRSSGPCSSRSRGRSRDPLLGAPVVDSVAADVSGGFDHLQSGVSILLASYSPAVMRTVRRVRWGPVRRRVRPHSSSVSPSPYWDCRLHSVVPAAAASHAHCFAAVVVPFLTAASGVPLPAGCSVHRSSPVCSDF